MATMQINGQSTGIVSGTYCFPIFTVTLAVKSFPFNCHLVPQWPSFTHSFLYFFIGEIYEYLEF